MNRTIAKSCFYFIAFSTLGIFLQGAPRPRLVVIVSVDQLSSHSVTRYQSQWSRGLKTLFK